MSTKTIVAIGLFYMYYHIGGLATTNILRLTSGNRLPVLSSTCVCDSCGEKIRILDQFPIVSYIFSKGKCKHCGAAIPVFPLILEIVIIFGMIAITSLFRMSYRGVLLSFLYYEVVRNLVIWRMGRREEDFVKQYLIAVAIMLTYWLPTLWAAFLYTIA